jgi:hypothetical protein
MKNKLLQTLMFLHLPDESIAVHSQQLAAVLTEAGKLCRIVARDKVSAR